LTVGDRRVGRAALVDEEGLGRFAGRSPLTGTVIVPVVWPAGMISVREAAW
jgi:hypothetical protein